jgi:hypothetical protein
MKEKKGQLETNGNRSKGGFRRIANKLLDA